MYCTCGPILVDVYMHFFLPMDLLYPLYKVIWEWGRVEGGMIKVPDSWLSKNQLTVHVYEKEGILLGKGFCRKQQAPYM